LKLIFLVHLGRVVTAPFLAVPFLNLHRVIGEERATRLHRAVGEEVRTAIRKIGGKMPETLPAEPNIKLLLKEQKKRSKELPDKTPPDTKTLA
jgi:hypothetical protein